MLPIVILISFQPNFQSSSYLLQQDLIFGDLILLIPGVIVMIIYTCVMLGRLTVVSSQVLLGLGGIVSVAFATLAAFGLGSWVGIRVGPVTTVLPFILLGNSFSHDP
tara:strand:+ start:836 stop:1156 length:321 start_codon:yes stop_codon:yes gene_type:complete